MSEATPPTGPDLGRRRHHLGLSVQKVFQVGQALALCGYPLPEYVP